MMSRHLGNKDFYALGRPRNKDSVVGQTRDPRPECSVQRSKIDSGGFGVKAEVHRPTAPWLKH